MQESEFQALLDNEDVHWWYSGRLRIVLAEVERLAPIGARILDAGCGSGRIVSEMSRLGEVHGVDASPRAVAASRARGLPQVVLGKVEHLPYADETFDLVTCLDVLEHTPDDLAALRELSRVTAPGGSLFVTVPAYPRLWSQHDVLNQHHRRYFRTSLRSAAARTGWQLERDTYFNTLLLAPAAAVRLASRLLPGAAAGARRSDLALTPPALNPLLELPMRLEAALIRRGLNLPAGLSLAATFRKPVQREARLFEVRPDRLDLEIGVEVGASHLTADA